MANKLLNSYLQLFKKFKALLFSYNKSRVAFKRLLAKYNVLRNKYLILEKHSSSQVKNLIDKITQEKYQIIIDRHKQLLRISDDFLKTIGMKKEEFQQSFYLDLLFDRYLPKITSKCINMNIEPFQFPILIDQTTVQNEYNHPYLHFLVSGNIVCDKKYGKLFYQLSFLNVTANVELDYFIKTDKLITSLSITNNSLIQAKKTIEMHKTMLIFLTCSLIEEYNQETSAHLLRIKEISAHICEECINMGIFKVNDYDEEEYAKDVNFTSVLHDVGKMGVPNEILSKKGKLTEDEIEAIHKHTIIGAQYIKKIIDFLSLKPEMVQYLKFLQIPYQICLYHHERWDGKGYPEGLKGTNIPLAARIVAIADTYDAIRMNRVYDKSRTHDEAVEIIKSESGKQFDPDIVRAFLNIREVLSYIDYSE